MVAGESFRLFLARRNPSAKAALSLSVAHHRASTSGEHRLPACSSWQLATKPFTFSVWDVMQEYQGNQGSTITARYVHGATGLVKNHLTNNYYYQDGSGSTSHLASSGGALLEWYRYDLQGTPIFYNAADVQISGSNAGVRHLFTGQQWYSQLGLYDLRNRFYSPDIGRFLQPDPIGFRGDPTNLYRYCGNNPTNRSDPSGLADVPKRPLEGLAPPVEVSASPLEPRGGLTLGVGGDWRGVLPGESLTQGGGRSGLGGDFWRGGSRLPAIAEAERVVVTGAPVEPLPPPPQNPFNDLLLNQLLFDLWMGPFHQETAIERAMRLTLHSQRQNKTNPFVSHYGPGDEIGGWDPYNDDDTNAGLNGWNHRLDQNTVAMNRAYAAQQGIQHYGAVFIGGQYIGLWTDTGPPFGRVDIYDPYNAAGTNWGGFIWDAEVSGHP